MTDTVSDTMLRATCHHGAYTASGWDVAEVAQAYFGSVNESISALRRAVADHLGHTVTGFIDPITLIIMGVEHGLTDEYLTRAMGEGS